MDSTTETPESSPTPPASRPFDCQLDREEFRAQLRDAERRRDRDPLYQLGKKHGLVQGHRDGAIVVLDAIGAAAIGCLTLYLSWKAAECAFEILAELLEQGAAPKGPGIKL
jgi:hypothetical protein